MTITVHLPNPVILTAQLLVMQSLHIVQDTVSTFKGMPVKDRLPFSPSTAMQQILSGPVSLHSAPKDIRFKYVQILPREAQKTLNKQKEVKTEEETFIQRFLTIMNHLEADYGYMENIKRHLKEAHNEFILYDSTDASMPQQLLYWGLSSYLYTDCPKRIAYLESEGYSLEELNLTILDDCKRSLMSKIDNYKLSSGMFQPYSDRQSRTSIELRHLLHHVMATIKDLVVNTTSLSEDIAAKLWDAGLTPTWEFVYTQRK